ncbi:MaoC/PaaZ C-terminal domain-containing protein [Sphingomonas canadensis]|uniref:MaoC/PaaZ C-terminal domain-containing protein n=1 Tax=Sphingomonas canadensis TaxID=1219257 RepID=A0ABW3H7D3_9SPHN|nr:MaoC/PaaZ C-terminal domain-containing protein [Sphingomonas canadensis]MCW3836940.1 MaoC/PaaZ C-terminal domain-containing protein [Sphingomonas canadensis]
MTANPTKIEPGAEFAAWQAAPITRTTLALYAGGSGDHNPLHVDIDFAREKAGMDDVIGHGMLTMALMGRYVTALVPGARLDHFSTRFVAMSRPGDAVRCTGRIETVEAREGGTAITVALAAERAPGEVLAAGQAVLFLSGDAAGTA